MLLDGENQCGDDLDDWFHFALNIVVSVIPIVSYKDGYGPKMIAINRACRGYYKPGQGNGTCEDKWPEDKCIKLMEADKCEKMGKNCKNTCNMCDDKESEESGKCKDKMPAKICKKIKKAGKCDKNADKCMKTCDFCDDDGNGSGKEVLSLLYIIELQPTSQL